MHKKLQANFLQGLVCFCVCSLLINIYLYYHLPSKPAVKVASTDWKKTTSSYLDEIYRVLGDNHPGAIGTEEGHIHFKTWLDLGYRKAKELSKQVNSVFGCRAVCLWYINKLHDSRTALYFPPDLNPSIWWPGFMLRYQNGKFYVSEVDKDLRFERLPPEGAEILALDGIDLKILMKQSILQYLGSSRFEKNWILYGASLLKYEEGNPWNEKFHRITVKEGDLVKNYPLEYQNLDLLDWERLHLKTLDTWFLQDDEVEVIEFAKKAYWIPIRSMKMENITPEIEKERQKIVNQVKEIHKPKVIVLDLRNNMGGWSVWGEEILEALFGKEYVDEMLYLHRKRSISAWRVSEENYLFIREQSHIKNPGKFKKRLNKRYALYYQEPKVTSPSKRGKALLDTLYTRIYVLTDPWTSGSALEFVRKINLLGRVIHVGGESFGESMYFCNRQHTLQNSPITLSFPIVYRQNNCQNLNKVIKPRFRYQGAFSDQKALMNWILEIDREITLEKL